MNFTHNGGQHTFTCFFVGGISKLGKLPKICQGGKIKKGRWWLVHFDQKWGEGTKHIMCLETNLINYTLMQNLKLKGKK